MLIRSIQSRVSHYIRKKRLAKRHIRIAHDVEIENVTFADYVNLAHHAQVSNSVLDCRTSVGRYSKIQMADIGKYCSISWDVTIGALEHPVHAISSHAFPYRKQFGICEKDLSIPHSRVHIGNDVWIGCGTIIMPGVKVGDGAIIGAGAVVTHDVEPYEIGAGCPAKHISFRFSPETIQRLEKLKWWDFCDDELRECASFFSPQVDIEKDEKVLLELIDLHEKRSNKHEKI